MTLDVAGTMAAFNEPTGGSEYRRTIRKTKRILTSQTLPVRVRAPATPEKLDSIPVLSSSSQAPSL